MVKEAPGQLDKAVDDALAWALDVLSWEVARGDPNFLKLHAIKAQAAALVGQLKARTDPAALRGGSKDVIGEVLARRIAAAKQAAD